MIVLAAQNKSIVILPPVHFVIPMGCSSSKPQQSRPQPAPIQEASFASQQKPAPVVPARSVQTRPPTPRPQQQQQPVYYQPASFFPPVQMQPRVVAQAALFLSSLLPSGVVIDNVFCSPPSLPFVATANSQQQQQMVNAVYRGPAALPQPPPPPSYYADTPAAADPPLRGSLQYPAQFVAPSQVTLTVPLVRQPSLLSGRDVFLLLDVSGSMCNRDEGADRKSDSRFEEAKRVADIVARRVDSLDPNGLDLAFFSTGCDSFSNLKSEAVRSLCAARQTGGVTNLKAALDWAFGLVAGRCAAQQSAPGGSEKKYRALVVVVTDGMPQTDLYDDSAEALARAEREVENSIVAPTLEMKRLGMRDEDVGVQIRQVGHDGAARDFLNRLDNLADTRSADLARDEAGKPFDIVDTTACDEILERGGLVAALERAIND